MVPSRAFLIALLLSLSAPSAFAQGMDDLLAPLTPSPGQSGKGKGKGKTKTSKRRAAKPKKGSKQKAAPVAEPEEEETTQSAESDLLAPLVKKTELLVKVGGGVRGARLFVDDQEVGTLPRGTVEVLGEGRCRGRPRLHQWRGQGDGSARGPHAAARLL
jgi:hypothetical protein